MGNFVAQYWEQNGENWINDDDDVFAEKCLHLPPTVGLSAIRASRQSATNRQVGTIRRNFGENPKHPSFGSAPPSGIIRNLH